MTIRPSQLLLAAVIVIVSLAGQAVIKHSLNDARQIGGNHASTIIRLMTDWQFFLGLIVTALGAVLYIALLYFTDLSRALPVMGAIGYIFIPVIGVFFLHEHFGLIQGVGLLLVITGGLLLAR